MRRSALAAAALAAALIVAREPRAPAARDELGRLGRGWTRFLAGAYDEAARELAPLAKSSLRTRDLALWLLGQSRFYAGDAAAALAPFQALEADRRSRLSAAASYRVADALWAQGRRAAAATAYDRALARDGAAGDAALARERLAEALAAAPEPKSRQRAEALFRRVYVEQPAHPAAERALAGLTALGGGVAPAISAEARLARAQRLVAARAWDRAIAELAALPTGAPEPLQVEAGYWLGTARYRTRHDYPAAAAGLLAAAERLPSPERRAEALFHGARALSRADRDDEAIRWYREVVARYPRSGFAAEARLLIGWLDYNRGRFAAALAPLEAAAAQAGEHGEEARWFHAFSLYLLGRDAEALTALAPLCARGGALSAGRARYWRARLLQRTGRTDEARADYRALVAAFPLSWYAQLARAQLRAQQVIVGPWGEAEGAPAPPAGDAPDLEAPDGAVARDPAIARVDELLAAGIGPLASDELRRAERALLARFGAARALPALLRRYRRAGDWNRPWALAEAYGARALSRPPAGRARAIWEHAYPLAYRELVERHAVAAGNPELFLYAIMRKESGFDPNDVSYADAQGLLQMIPPTSRRVAAALGEPYVDGMLYEPAANVRLGAWYIGRLFQKFKRQVPLAAGAYNGGPRAMMKWCGERRGRPLDEFVELVPYTQTREYMKKVSDYHARYLLLWRGEDVRLDLAVDAAFLEDAVDY